MAKTGLAALKDSIERGKTKFSGGGGGRLNYFAWKEDGDKFVVRFLTDDVITTRFYEWVMTKDGKSTRDFISAPDYFDNPTTDWVQKYQGQSRDFKTKQLLPAKSREMTVGMAVMREEYTDSEGQPAVRDKLDKTEVDGTKFDTRWFGIIKQAHGNFWDNAMVYYSRWGTLCDRDYEITRTGKGVDTKYHFLALDKDPALKNEAEVQKAYGYGAKRPEGDPKRFLYVPQTLKEWCDQYASEDRARYWLDGAAAAAAPVVDDSVYEETPQGTDADTTDEYEALRQSLLSSN